MTFSFHANDREQAFKLLFEQYYAPFCLYAKRFIEDKETREDIVSDVFASLWDRMETVDTNSGTTLAYIKTCVKNSCLNYLKHQEHESDYAERIRKRAPVYETEPDSVYTLEDLYRMLHETLDKLPEAYRIVFMESCFQKKTHAEIAAQLNLSVKSVNRYKQKTIELLRKELKDYLILLLIFIA